MIHINSEINNALSKGLDFLHKNQLPYGEFKTYVFPDKTMTGQGKYVSTTYITTFVLYSLSFIEDPRVHEMTQKALGFLQQEMEGKGVWRFFGTNRSLRMSQGNFVKFTPISAAPDLDDTACVTYCLKINGINSIDNREIFLKNRNEEGLFYTWLLDYPKSPEFDEKTMFLQPKENDIDCGVIANILLYLGDSEETLQSSRYIKRVMDEGVEETNIPYFPDKLTLYYLISRACFNGVESLVDVKDIILKHISEIVDIGICFVSVLSVAYIACIMMNFNCYEDSLISAVKYIIDKQKQDGSWAKERFCDGIPLYYGSEELTTAICLEALARYERWSKRAT